ncbi:MAG: 2-octaprenyl-6-methoxyphenyl hydroxylase [Gammaproteobacteria bacterium]|nr:MAG: 2-octaprenyl-6-methoxyphenyl hydroxylase [Gammaproteobacteria bacterium]
MVDEAEFDLIIVGGGLVGASLACSLAISKLRIAVVEAVPFRSEQQPSFDDRTVALACGSRRILETMGLWSRMDIVGGCDIKTIHISDRGHFGFARLHASDAGLDALGYVIPTRTLGAALLAGMSNAENITIFCPASVESVVVHDDSAEVVIEEAGQHRTIGARLLVAADGVHSTIREKIGIPYRQRMYQQTAIVTNIETELPHQQVAYERFMQTGPLALLPMDKERCAVVWSNPADQADEMLAWDDETFLAALQHAFGDRLGKFGKIGRRVSYPLALTEVEETVKSRLVLIGNAAHTVHPVAGQGFNLGLRDVATLAEEIVEAQRGNEDFGTLEVLQRYQQRRRRDTRAVSRFTDGLIRIFSNTLTPLSVLRNASLVAVDLFPGIKKMFIRRTSGLTGRLPRLARGLRL